MGHGGSSCPSSAISLLLVCHLKYRSLSFCLMRRRVMQKKTFCAFHDVVHNATRNITSGEADALSIRPTDLCSWPNSKITAVRKIKHQKFIARCRQGLSADTDSSRAPPARGTPARPLSQAFFSSTLRSDRRQSAYWTKDTVRKKLMIRPGLEPGISGSGGRRLIH